MGRLARNVAIAVLWLATGAPLGCGRTEDTSAGPGTPDGSSDAVGGTSGMGGGSGTGGNASPSPSTPNGNVGGSASLDGSATLDSSTDLDATTPDASIEGIDAAGGGSQTDAGAVRDASLQGVDAGGGGAQSDAGAVRDASSSADASVPVDAGAPVDAGSSEGGVIDAGGGGCAATCSLPHASSTCAGGTCEIASCDVYYADCDGDPSNGCEASLNADPANCGGCGLSCGACGCLNGVCLLCGCSPGTADCDGSLLNGCEVNLSSNAAHCGFCGNGCGQGEPCVGGQCLAAGNPCVDSSDCADLPGSEPACCDQICRLDCDPRRSDCDGDASNGCEANLDTDPDHCGACGAACLPSEFCRLGECRPAVCTAPFANCGGNVGCDTNTDTDPSNCGGCGVVCSIANGMAGCTAGSCTIARCAYGWADCNGLAGDGCEASMWQCLLPCNTGDFRDCDGLAANGCETNVGYDEDNCGDCGYTCIDTGCVTAPSECFDGICYSAGGCLFGLADCDGNVANGCETNLMTSLINCGVCGRPCPPQGAVHVVTGQCAGCECHLGCESGWEDCDGDPANGCETQLCGRSCP